MGTFNFSIVCLGLSHQQSSRLSIQGIGWVGVPQQLWQKDLEDIYQIKHR